MILRLERRAFNKIPFLAVEKLALLPSARHQSLPYVLSIRWRITPTNYKCQAIEVFLHAGLMVSVLTDTMTHQFEP